MRQFFLLTLFKMLLSIVVVLWFAFSSYVCIKWLHNLSSIPIKQNQLYKDGQLIVINARSNYSTLSNISVVKKGEINQYT